MSEPAPRMSASGEVAEQRVTAAPIVILNPVGANGRARRLRPLIERALHGGRGHLCLTAAPRDAVQIAREAAESGRDIIVVGGDGTIIEVAEGILTSGRRVSLGIVPAGTGNDYAFETLRLPHDPLAALERALTGTPVPMDVGAVNGRYFVNSLGVGIDANIAHTAEHIKRVPFLRGQTLYWTATLNELLLHYDRCPQLTVSYDGQPAGDTRHYALAAISIGPTYGGGFRINPLADPSDGYFDLCTMWKPPLGRALRLLPKVEKGLHLTEPEVTHTRVQHIILESDTPIYAQLDGEVITGKRFEARILPGALLVRR